METLAVVVLSWCALAYAVLGGADLGVGIVLHHLGRDAGQRRVVLAAIAPFFLGDEVWLVATVGVLAGAFPALEARLVHGLAAALVPLAVAWVVRDMGLWLRGRVGRPGWARGCDAAVTAGSVTVVACWGWILAGLAAGPPAGLPYWPAALSGAAAAVALVAAHGLGLARLRLTGVLRARAGAPAGRVGGAAVFAATGAALAAAVLLAGARWAPAGSAADPATLDVLVPALLAVLPPVLAVQAWGWLLFRHRVTAASYL